MDNGLEEFFGPDFIKRVRLTPAGARAVGQWELAIALEKCKAGEHQFLEAAPFCVCGEKRAPA